MNNEYQWLVEYALIINPSRDYFKNTIYQHFQNIRNLQYLEGGQFFLARNRSNHMFVISSNAGRVKASQAHNVLVRQSLCR